jgi:lipopolysaccharide/colanic/teichoic acid biosynthesis glycosyltransferase
MYQKYLKRTFDTIISIIVLMLSLPVGIIVAVIIKLDSKGPAIFRQKRTGLNGSIFSMYKFRTMSCDNNVHDIKESNRITTMGKIIRALSLDEIPQYLNVIKGEMSFIGPRPWIPEYYDNMTNKQRQRNSVRPGITGLAQARGRNTLSVLEKINLDLLYIKNVTFTNDVKIVALTVLALFKRTGAAIEKHGIHQEINILKLQQNKKLTDSSADFFSSISNASKSTNRIKRTGDDLVSIIVPVYNAEKFLPDTIATVQNQTYTNWELIFVDDCSKDKSINIIEKYARSDKRIRLYKNKVNSHAALTRNKGIDEANGRYIAFLDADDLWEPTKLEKQIAFMNQKDCAFSYTGYEFSDENGKPNGKKVIAPETLTYKQALRNTIIWTTTVMFDMSKLTKEDINMPNVKSEDTACWWKVLKQIDRAYGMKDILSYYRRSSGTLSANKVEAVKRVWNLYRKVEKHNLIYSAYCFSGYAYNTVKKRV